MKTDLTELLIVDDDTVYRERLAKAFRARDRIVHAAAGKQEALEIVQRNEDIGEAVIDLQMPDGHGLDLMHELKSIRPGLKLIVLTGFGSIASALKAVRVGAVDYLTKPCDADQILSALANPGASLASSQQNADSSVPSLDRVEWEHIQRVLEECGGNVSQAARLLGLHRRSLQRKLSKLPPAAGTG
jgi:two-component system response regulator RegA